jgi:hypothetical protein
MKGSKLSQNNKEELKKSSKAQKAHKSQKLPLNQTPPNTLNASSPT